jgi:transposase-like protein
MRNNPSCPRCQKSERVSYAILVQSERPERLYYCASCDHTWKAVEDDETIASDEVLPKRSRDS